MADFISRLAERALGVAQVVQPVMPSIFAPEPLIHSPGSEHDGEAATPSDYLVRTQAPFAEETLPARDAPTAHPQYALTGHQRDHRDSSPATPDTRSDPQGQADGAATPSDYLVRTQAPFSEETLPARNATTDHRDSSPAMPGSPLRTPESRPGPSYLDESGPSERVDISGKEDQRDSSRSPAKHPRASELQPATLQRTEPGPKPPGALSTPQRVLTENLPLSPPLAEDESGQAALRSVRTLVDHGSGETPQPVPSPGTQSSLDAGEDTSGSKTTLDRPEPSDSRPLVAPRRVRPQLDGHRERGSEEPHAAPPESPAPTIRVAIGRIEVRAITPPPMPPAQRTAPTRPGPALSLDDYLKQHNGRRR
jgi:hypothetical protein